ncbi:MAG: hypothetical protein JWN44_2928 [Myxococcales bacterium]|nr:hypothetical protein [Myxococcales bacterium]
MSLFVAAALGAAPLAANAQGTLVALQAPDGRGKAFDLSSLRGQVVAVTFTSRYTQDEASRVNEALGARTDVKVVSVVDFMGIPGFVHNYARRKVAEADGKIQHLCDERGQLRRQFGAHPDKHVDIFVIDRDGNLRGRFEGQPQLEGALRLLDEVRAARAER